MISASKDTTINVLDSEGEVLSSVKHNDGFACMEVLGTAPWNSAISIIVAADLK
jgi:hypothetical protein